MLLFHPDPKISFVKCFSLSKDLARPPRNGDHDTNGNGSTNMTIIISNQFIARGLVPQLGGGRSQLATSMNCTEHEHHG